MLMGMKQLLTPVTAVFLIVLVDVLGYTIILPLLPFYAESFGASPFVIGMLTASYAFFQMISGPFLGRLSDKMGRKPLLQASQVGTLAGFLILAFAPSLPWLFIGRILDGFTAGNISLAQATISDVTTREERGKAFAKIGIAFGVGFLVGPALSGYLSQFGAHVPILVGAGLSALSLVATTYLLPGDVKYRDKAAATASPATLRGHLKIVDVASVHRFFRQPILAMRLTQFFLFILSFAMWTSGFALFAGRQLTFGDHPFGAREVGYVLAYGGLLGILLQGLLMGRLLDRFGERVLSTVGLIGMSCGYLILSLASGLSLTLAAATFLGLGHGMTRPSLTSLVTQAAARDEQGAVLGVSQSLQAMAQTLAPLLGGFLIEHGWTHTWAVCASLFAFGSVLTLKTFRRGKLMDGAQPHPT